MVAMQLGRAGVRILSLYRDLPYERETLDRTEQSTRSTVAPFRVRYASRVCACVSSPSL